MAEIDFDPNNTILNVMQFKCQVQCFIPSCFDFLFSAKKHMCFLAGGALRAYLDNSKIEDYDFFFAYKEYAWWMK